MLKDDYKSLVVSLTSGLYIYINLHVFIWQMLLSKVIQSKLQEIKEMSLRISSLKFSSKFHLTRVPHGWQVHEVTFKCLADYFSLISFPLTNETSFKKKRLAFYHIHWFGIQMSNQLTFHMSPSRPSCPTHTCACKCVCVCLCSMVMFDVGEKIGVW